MGRPDHELITTLTGRSYGVNEFAFAPDGRWFATASDDGTVKLWDTATFRELATLDGFGGPVWCLAVSPDGKTIATGVGENYANPLQRPDAVTLWDVETRSAKARTVWSSLPGNVCSILLRMAPSWPQRAATTWRVWSLDDGRELSRGVQFGAACIRYSKDGSILVSGGFGTPPTVIIWDQNTLRPKSTFRCHYRVHCVAVSDDNSLIAAGNRACSIEVWNVKNRHSRRLFKWRS